MKKEFTQANNCKYPNMCTSECTVASIIRHETSVNKRSGDNALETVIDPGSYHCSHPKAVEAREKGRKVLDES